MLSFSGVPSGWRMIERNWYRALYASMAMILPLKSSSLTWVFGMRSLKFTPKTTPVRIMAKHLNNKLAKNNSALQLTDAYLLGKALKGKI